MFVYIAAATVFLIGAGIVSGLMMFRKVPVPGKTSATGSKRHVSLSVIIPARNEVNRIGYLLGSLQTQTLQKLEIIVVDDDSTDGTVALARSYGATVIKNADLQDDGCGKSLACWSGANAATGDLFLFMDADTVLESPDSLERVLTAYEQCGSKGILSLQPYLVVRESYENLAAIFNIIVMTGINVFSIFGTKLRTAGSFGPFILTGRDDYFRSGGHEHIQEAIMDDLALGEAYHSLGLPVRCQSGKGIVGFSYYSESPFQLIQSWIKNFGTASQSTHPFIMLLINVWVAGSIASPLYVIGALVMEYYGHLSVSLILYAVCMAVFYKLANKTGSYAWWIYPLYPFQIAAFIIIFMRSIYLTKIRKSVTWRGRKINV